MEYEDSYEDQERLIEPDPGHIAFLDQQSAAFESDKEEFFRTYGFEHTCTCGTDYTSNQVGLVTECFIRLSTEALSRAAYLNQVNKVMSEALDQSVQITNDLVGMMQDNNMKDELEAYFNQEIDLDSPENPEEDLENLLKLIGSMYDDEADPEEAANPAGD